MRNYLILLFKKDHYRYNEDGTPLETVTVKKVFPDYMFWQKGDNIDKAVGILYQRKQEIFIETDHYAVFSGWRAYLKFSFYILAFWRYF